MVYVDFFPCKNIKRGNMISSTDNPTPQVKNKIKEVHEYSFTKAAVGFACIVSRGSSQSRSRVNEHRYDTYLGR